MRIARFTTGDDPRYALGCDLIAPHGWGEMIGGGIREEDYDTLKAAVIHHKLPVEDYQWYLDLRADPLGAG